MIKKAIFSFFCFIFLANVLSAQDLNKYSWWNPARNNFPTLEGQAWPGDVKDFYDRLPAKAEEKVRKEVWELSRHTAGLYIKFMSNASNIIVRYGTTNKQNFAMQHMPATGVSGVDLFVLDLKGNWKWAPGKRSFGDTVIYRFMDMQVDAASGINDHEFRLFLPLYNGVTWMEIGVPEGTRFQPLPLAKEKPIVFYGTSILQGGCASRPGLAWTSIVERHFNCPVINLGFSGNGRLEPEVIDLINEIDARLYVLDCIPNLVHGNVYTDEELSKRVVNSINSIREKHPDVPILLSAHSISRSEGIVDTAYYIPADISSAVQERVVDSLKKKGVKGLYLISSKEIGFDIDATVDGVHPNDIGMRYYADAFIKRITDILSK